MTELDKEKLLSHASERAGERPEFLGYLFHIHCKAHSLDRATLAKEVATSEKMIVRMSLCLRPGKGSRSFGDDIDRIAAQFSASPDRLAHIVRSAEALEVFQNASFQGLRFAAREWEDDNS